MKFVFYSDIPADAVDAMADAREEYDSLFEDMSEDEREEIEAANRAEIDAMNAGEFDWMVENLRLQNEALAAEAERDQRELNTVYTLDNPPF